MKKNAKKQQVEPKVKKVAAKVEPESINSDVDPQPEPETLTDSERDELVKFEQTIKGAEKQFLALGGALHAILDKNLYKEFSDFDSYCDRTWGFTGSHARRLIDSHKVVEVLRSGSSPIGEDLLPRNEFQARLLHGSGKESSWRGNWNKVLAAAEQSAKAITGSLVKKTLEPESGAKTTTKRSKTTDAVGKVLKWIEETRESLESIDDAKALLNKIEKVLKRLTKYN